MATRLPLSSQRSQAVVQIGKATLADLAFWEASAVEGAGASAYLHEIQGEMDLRVTARNDRRFWAVARTAIWIGGATVLTLVLAISALPGPRG